MSPKSPPPFPGVPPQRSPTCGSRPTSIPYMVAHKPGQTAGLFFLNSAEMWVDIQKKSTSSVNAWANRIRSLVTGSPFEEEVRAEERLLPPPPRRKTIQIPWPAMAAPIPNARASWRKPRSAR
jgi:hypothetical protein